jgi:hypothetical protein
MDSLKFHPVRHALAFYGKTWCIEHNLKKTKVMKFGKSHDFTACIADLTLDRKSIEFVNEWKYLGVMIKSGRF